MLVWMSVVAVGSGVGSRVGVGVGVMSSVGVGAFVCSVKNVLSGTSPADAVASVPGEGVFMAMEGLLTLSGKVPSASLDPDLLFVKTYKL